MKNLKTPSFEFTSKEWTEYLNTSNEKVSYYPAFVFASTFINSVKDMFCISSDDFRSLFTDELSHSVLTAKIKRKYLVYTNYTPSAYRKYILKESVINRFRLLYIAVVNYDAYRAWMSSHRFSALDGLADKENVLQASRFYLDNQSDSDWKQLLDYVLEVNSVNE